MTPLSPEDSHHVIDATAYSWPYIGIALLGGVARAARFGVRSVRQFLCGLLCILTLYGQDIPAPMAGAIVGMVGYSGGSILDAVLGMIKRWIERRG